MKNHSINVGISGQGKKKVGNTQALYLKGKDRRDGLG